VYVCEHCHLTIDPNTPSYLLPVKIRRKQYPFRSAANEYIDPASGRQKQSDDPGGTGYETVREIRVCKNCYHKSGMPQIE